MDQKHEAISMSAAVERAEQLLDGAGQQATSLFANAGQLIQSTASTLSEKVRQAGQSTASTLSEKVRQTGQSTKEAKDYTTSQRKEPSGASMEQAEKMVSDTGQRITIWSSQAGRQIQRVTGRIYEDVEDIWAESQNIRRTRRTRTGQ